MSKSIFSASHFNDEQAAYDYVEARVWPNGRVCPHCGVIDKSGKLQGKSNRIGLYKCYACRKPFTVKVGTIFEASHIQMRDWLTAMALMTASKKGISANQLHRTLGITLKSAWFMAHRIREAMLEVNPGPLGGAGQVVEIDETFLGKNKEIFVTGKGWQKQRSTGALMKVVALVERGGRSRSVKVEDLTLKSINPVVLGNVDTASAIHTDEARHYERVGRRFADHQSVDHGAKEYARGDVTTNTVEGFFSIFKRGMTGVYQHCGEKHLQRYLTEFDFRYSNRVALGIHDDQRAERVLKGVTGRRLTYRTTRQGTAS